MSGVLLAILAVVHILVSGAVFFLIRAGILGVPKAYIIIVLLVPVFGLASLAGMELAGRFQANRRNAGNADDSGSTYGMIEKDEDDHCTNLVPVEEALLLNDVKTRRKIIMDILQDDPMRYIGQLKTARMNSDMEVTHYATTTIMEIQRDFDTAIQRLDQRLGQDGPVLDEAIGLTGRYIESGLLDGYTLTRMRERFGDLLSRKAALQPDDRKTRLALARNKIELGDFEGASAEIEVIAGLWPASEEVWLLGIRLAVERHDNQYLDAWHAQMLKTSVRWSERGRDELQFWFGDIETTVTESVKNNMAV